MKRLFILSTLITLFGLNMAYAQMAAPTDKVAVFNFDDKEALKEYESLKLDDSHPNLLDPSLSKESHEEVIENWTELHQELAGFLAEKKFDWGTEESNVAIVHKIYFAPSGEITAYFFNVLNSDIPESKTAEFAELVGEFADTAAIALTRESTFAQCGKTRYPVQ